jgi:hypothetical protein
LPEQNGCVCALTADRYPLLAEAIAELQIFFQYPDAQSFIYGI